MKIICFRNFYKNRIAKFDTDAGNQKGNQNGETEPRNVIQATQNKANKKAKIEPRDMINMRTRIHRTRTEMRSAL